MIELNDIKKEYEMGENVVHALRGVSLKIEPGEFVAIMGPSGSGKSTLLHIIGLLDTPDSGSYLLNGNLVSGFSEDQLSVERRKTCGFVFQQFNLLPRMSAIQNVALPLIYSRGEMDLSRAEELLKTVGLGERLHHKPNELSGGQQQRVAIARSLVNSPKLILADEPTGNLDSDSQLEIMAILSDLNKKGITLVMVTHEEEIADFAQRIIRMRDGHILSDDRQVSVGGSTQSRYNLAKESGTKNFGFKDIWEYIRQGVSMLMSNKLRTILSMLGILIGVAAIVAMLAVGRGAQKQIEMQLSSLGSNLLMLRPGARHVGGVVLDVGAVTRITPEDASSIVKEIPGVTRASSAVMGRGQVTFADKNWNTQIMGVEPSYAEMRSATPVIGRFFTNEDNTMRSRVAVIGATIVRELFGGSNPVGESIKINKVNFRVIGVLAPKGATGWRDQDDVIVMPLQTAMHRLLGKDYVDSIDIEVSDPSIMSAVEKSVNALMLERHRVPPTQVQGAFEIRNMADIKAALSESSRTMGFLLSSIAAIALLVGGIGIMNIMLVTVTERTREIGLRKAVGAGRKDVLFQFLVEAVVISGIGGLMGIALGWLSSTVISWIAGWATQVSIQAVLLSLIFSGAIRITFGLYPAKKASYLNPIEALRYE